MTLCDGCGEAVPVEQTVVWLTIERGPVRWCGACSDAARRHQEESGRL